MIRAAIIGLGDISFVHLDGILSNPEIQLVAACDLNEELNADFLVSHYGVKKSDVDFVKRNEWAAKGSAKGYLNARAFARNERLKDDSVFEEFIKPIDLSDEILGHNFPTSELLAWWRCEDKDKGYHIEYTPDGDFPSGDYGEFVECVKSVHELQHLMLAHGIEHKIEIENYMFTENTEL